MYELLNTNFHEISRKQKKLMDKEFFFGIDCTVSYPIMGAFTDYLIAAYGREAYLDLYRRQDMRKAMKEVLDERECEIIVMRYGMFGAEEKTQQEVGKKYGISRSYVSRIEKRALQKLRAQLEK